MTDWPSALPQAFLVGTYKKNYADNRLRSQNDVGPAKVRRRASQNVAMVTGRMLMTSTQKSALDTFVNSTTTGGADKFNFPDPEGGSDLEVRFASKLPEASERQGQYMVELELEVLP